MIMRYTIPLIFFMAFTSPLPVSGDHIHHWRDSSGVLHFTDNPCHVPAQYRQGSSMEIEDFDSDDQVAKIEDDDDEEFHGLELWSYVCASCHHTGFGFKGDKVGLGRILVDRTTRFPKTVEQIVSKLKHATSGRLSDMPKIDVSDEGLLGLAEYLLDKDTEE